MRIPTKEIMWVLLVIALCVISYPVIQLPIIAADEYLLDWLTIPKDGFNQLGLNFPLFISGILVFGIARTRLAEYVAAAIIVFAVVSMIHLFAHPNEDVMLGTWKLHCIEILVVSAFCVCVRLAKEQSSKTTNKTKVEHYGL